MAAVPSKTWKTAFRNSVNGCSGRVAATCKVPGKVVAKAAPAVEGRAVQAEAVVAPS